MEKSITSTDSTNNLKRLPKKAFLHQYKAIVDQNIMEKVVPLKNGSKIMYTANKIVYIESIRKLLKEYNSTHITVSLTMFFNFKPFYCVRPSEKEKQSCVCINCQNPHLLLQAINRYRTSKQLKPHESLTLYIQELKSGKKFDELDDDKLCTFHKYERILESYTKRDGTSSEYKRVTRIVYFEPAKDICKQVLESGNTYLKHRTYVDNCSTVFSQRKEAYDGKYTELDFSQNLALRAKDEVQSAHFSGKQFTLHCAIVEPVDYRYHSSFK